MQPWITSFIARGEDDELTSLLNVPEFFNDVVTIGSRSIKLEDTDVVEQLISDGTIVQGTPESLHLNRNDANYQTPATGSAKVILIVQAVSATTNVHFKVYEGGTVDSLAGATLLYDFPQGLTNNLDKNTTKVLAVTNSKFITIEVVTASDAVNVEAYVIETPA